MEELYSGHGWQVVLQEKELPDGRIKKAARAKRADSVILLAFPTDDTILILREYRPYYGEYLWMLPSGNMDKENDMMVAALRELREETGFQADEVTHYCDANVSESLILTHHVFIAKKLSPNPLPQYDDEMIEVHTIKLEEALEKILTSPKVHMPSAFALMKYLHEHATIQP